MLSYPGPNYKTVITAVGIPGPAQFGNFDSSRSGAAGVAALKALQDDGYIRLDLHRGGNGPVRGIGIAPDSAIHTCDIALAGRDGEIDRYRVSPGNPLLGYLDDVDYAWVSLPNSMGAQVVQASDIWFDAVRNQLAGVTTLAGFPLRLEIYRGEVMPVRSNRRAIYVAHGVQILTGANADMYVCVDGRSKMDIQISMDAAGTPAVITCFSMEAVKGTTNIFDAWSQTPMPLDSAGNLSKTATNAAPVTLQFEGSPMTAVRINAAVAGGPSQIQIKLKAWD